MRKIYIIILLLFGFNQANAQLIIGRYKPVTPILFVQLGESNSGGEGANTSATMAELAIRNIKILNNTTLLLEPLHIGVNNQLGHVGFECCTTTLNGWELGLANRYDSNDFNGRQVFDVKAGQGGSQIANWAVGATYTQGATIQPYATALLRINTAREQIRVITGEYPEIVFIWSLGINDYAHSVNATTWKAAVKSVFNQFRSDLGIGRFLIYMMKFEFYSGSPYETQIDEIATELPNIVTFSTSGMTSNAGDPAHEDYASLKTNIYNIVLNYINR